MTELVMERPLGLLLVTAGIGVAAWGLLYGHRPLRRYEQQLEPDLAFVGGPSARVVSTAQGAALAVLTGVAFWSGASALVAFAVPIALGPRLALAHARASRVRAIESQLDGWLTALSNSLVATGSLAEALLSSARLVQRPLRDEIDRLSARVRLGTPVDRALARLGERVGSPLLSRALLSLRIARTSGGELRPMLQTAASALRDVARFEGLVRAKTSEGKAQAVAVSIVPAPLVLAIQVMAPDFFAPLGRSTTGAMVIAAAVSLWIVAIVLAAKITAVDV